MTRKRRPPRPSFIHVSRRPFVPFCLAYEPLSSSLVLLVRACLLPAWRVHGSSLLLLRSSITNRPVLSNYNSRIFTATFIVSLESSCTCMCFSCCPCACCRCRVTSLYRQTISMAELITVSSPFVIILCCTSCA